MIPKLKIRNLFKKRPKTKWPIHIGIKWQLSLLACCSALCALGALAVATVSFFLLLPTNFINLILTFKLRVSSTTPPS